MPPTTAPNLADLHATWRAAWPAALACWSRFVQLTEPAETPYGSGTIGSKYQGQQGPTPSRYWQNFAGESTT